MVRCVDKMVDSGSNIDVLSPREMYSGAQITGETEGGRD